MPTEVDKNVIFETVIEEPVELPKPPSFTKPDNVPIKTPTTIHKYGDQDVLNVEIIEYEIDDSQIEDEEIENQLLQRSMSVNDLSTLLLTADEKKESENNSAKLVPLARSLSMNNLEDENGNGTDLKNLNPDSSFLKSAVESLEEHRQEQATIGKKHALKNMTSLLEIFVTKIMSILILILFLKKKFREIAACI